MTGPVNVYTQGTGTAVINPVVELETAPNENLIVYPVKQIAIVPSTNKVYVLTSKESQGGLVKAIWTELQDQTPNTFPISAWVVGRSGQAGYQTIQSAIDAAVEYMNANFLSSVSIYIQPGIYPESLTIPEGVSLIGATAGGLYGTVTISGSHEIVDNGSEKSVSFKNLLLTSSVEESNVISYLSENNVELLIENCNLRVNAGYLVLIPNSINSSVRFENCIDSSSVPNGFISMPGGIVVVNSCFFGDVLTSTNGAQIGGELLASNSYFSTPIYLFNTGGLSVDGSCVFLQTITFAQNTNGAFLSSCFFANDVAPCIIHNSSGTVNLYAPVFTGGFTPSLTGTGAFVVTGLSTTSNAVFNPGLNVFVNNTSISGQVSAIGDLGGLNSAISLTGSSAASGGVGVGTISMSSANPGTNSQWIKIYIETTPYWIPAWTTNAP